jgi:2-oxoglutarate dehydrogenase E1 component
MLLQAGKRLCDGPLSALRLLTTSAGALQLAAPKSVPIGKLKDSFNDGTSVSYLEELEEKWYKDPNSIDKSWASFFKNLGEQAWVNHMHYWTILTPLRCVDNGVSGEAMAEAFHDFEQGKTGMSPFTAAAIANQTTQESMRLLLMVRSFQVGEE